MLVTKSTSHQLIWLKILAEGDNVPLAVLAKIGGVGKTQAFNIVQWGKELQGGNSPKILQKPEVKKLPRVVNMATGKKFSSTGVDNTKYVTKRLSENYSFEDFKHVIDVKTAKWKGTDMDEYLRPQTLFGSKFNAYLNETINNGRQQTSSIQQTIDTAQRVAESFDWGLDSE